MGFHFLRHQQLKTLFSYSLFTALSTNITVRTFFYDGDIYYLIFSLQKIYLQSI